MPLLTPNYCAKETLQGKPCFVLLAQYLHPMPNQQHQCTEVTWTFFRNKTCNFCNVCCRSCSGVAFIVICSSCPINARSSYSDYETFLQKRTLRCVVSWHELLCVSVCQVVWQVFHADRYPERTLGHQLWALMGWRCRSIEVHDRGVQRHDDKAESSPVHSTLNCRSAWCSQTEWVPLHR